MKHVKVFQVQVLIFCAFLPLLGRQYNKHGNYESWWTEESVQHFKELSKCFVEEYSNFTLAGLHVYFQVLKFLFCHLLLTILIVEQFLGLIYHTK